MKPDCCGWFTNFNPACRPHGARTGVVGPPSAGAEIAVRNGHGSNRSNCPEAYGGIGCPRVQGVRLSAGTSDRSSHRNGNTSTKKIAPTANPILAWCGSAARGARKTQAINPASRTYSGVEESPGFGRYPTT